METPICMRTLNENSVARLLRSFCSAWLALCAASLLVVAGCSSGNPASAKPVVGPILFTDANGKQQMTSPTTLIVSQGTFVSVNLSSDPKLLGVDWSVACGSALPPGTPLPPGQTQDTSCGTFTPAHTMSGPVPPYLGSGAGYVAFYTAPPVPPATGVVTLYASATADHTRYTSVTLNVSGLPISLGFAPAPPATLGTNASTQFRVVVNNDIANAGVTWSLVCSTSNCGSIGPIQTASGVSTTFSAPPAVPNGGTVKVTATSITDPTKSVTATVQILPITISVSPTTLSVPTAGTGSLAAIVANDGTNSGVDWSVSCTNTTSPGNCGNVTSHTASGGTATYTAPSIANIAVDSTILITATSTSNPAQSATATVTTVKGNLVTGTAQAAQQPVSGAQVTLYAAATSGTALNTTNNATAVVTAMTDQDGNFSIPYGYECPTPDTQMYLVSNGGNAGGGTNSDLALMTALGSCSSLDASRVTINEATTTAAVYALSTFMTDAQHVGSSSASPSGMAAAFATAKDLVDTTSGVPRTHTVSGAGVVPQTKINMFVNLLSACAKTAGSTRGDGSVCDQLFRATNPSTTPATQASDTVQALLDLARNATGFSNNPGAVTSLYQLVSGTSEITEPSDWTLAIEFPSTSAKALSKNSTNAIDSAGNVWVRGSSDATTEFVGGASCAALIPTAAISGNTP